MQNHNEKDIKQPSVNRFNQGNVGSLFLKKSVLSGESLDGTNGLTTDIFNLNNEVFAVQKNMENSNFAFGVLILRRVFAKSQLIRLT